jgi:LysM repeat protein
MTSAGEPEPTRSRTPGQAGRAGVAPSGGVAVATAAADARPAAPAPDRVACPFLVAEGGGWRLAMPVREHRCAAVQPPAPLAPDKQARLCLTATHPTCATYLASSAARGVRLGKEPVVAERTTRWGYARTTSVIEDRGGLRTILLALVLDRRRWPAIPAVLLVTTLVTLAISGFRPDLPATAVATASPVPVQPQTPSPEPTLPEPTPEPSIAPTPVPTAVPTVVATPNPSPTYQTYRVRSGDTLSAIANRFNTTSRAIAQLNGITVTSTLRIGQILLIPNPT